MFERQEPHEINPEIVIVAYREHPGCCMERGNSGRAQYML